MKLFIKNFLFFICGGVALFTLIFLYLHTVHKFRPENSYYCNHFNNAFKNFDYELVALGNSKMLSSINNEILEKELKLKTVNLGFSSSNISISKLTLEAYINKAIVPPKALLLEVSWFTFNNERTGFHQISGDLMLTDYNLLVYLFRYPKAWKNLVSSSLKYLESVFTDIKYTDYSFRENVVKEQQNESHLFNKDAFYKVFPLNKAGVDSILLEDFYSIINICIMNNIKVILYTAPEDDDYVDLQYDKMNIISIFNNISEKYENIVYLNYTKGGSKYQPHFNEWLIDSHHIIENEKFSYELAEDILNTRILQ